MWNVHALQMPFADSVRGKSMEQPPQVPPRKAKITRIVGFATPGLPRKAGGIPVAHIKPRGNHADDLPARLQDAVDLRRRLRGIAIVAGPASHADDINRTGFQWQGF